MPIDKVTTLESLDEVIIVLVVALDRSGDAAQQPAA